MQPNPPNQLNPSFDASPSASSSSSSTFPHSSISSSSISSSSSSSSAYGSSSSSSSSAQYPSSISYGRTFRPMPREVNAEQEEKNAKRNWVNTALLIVGIAVLLSLAGVAIAMTFGLAALGIYAGAVTATTLLTALIFNLTHKCDQENVKEEASSAPFRRENLEEEFVSDNIGSAGPSSSSAPAPAPASASDPSAYSISSQE